MRGSRNIYLIGPMGAGKTTIGRQLARQLKFDFYDSDWEIESRSGVSIPMIFEYEGEQGFRKRECAMLAELTGLSPIVLATGGGSILAAENRQALSENGFVVYLRCSVSRQLERTMHDNNRPLLKDHPRDCLDSLMKVRSPLYQSCADITVDTGSFPNRMAVKRILEGFRSSQA
ncbi:MAG: shikimate kinase AroK [Methylococcaceae bacterium]|nr:shikimate kinase AroK [Methylococcaceae bacterium]